MSDTPTRTYRVLTIDDNNDIHADFRKILAPVADGSDALADVENALFGSGAGKARPVLPRFVIDSALQGEEGYRLASQAVAAGQPYTVAFVDMRMPPGWDGVQTIHKLWSVDPDLQVVICTAYSDYSWDQIAQALGASDRLLILKKPFDAVEVCQLATALSEKWRLGRAARERMMELESAVAQRTEEIRQAALHDKLTGLGNRILLDEWLERALSRYRRDRTFIPSVLFLDFDRFKLVNDSLGHTAGDELLRQIAERISGALRAGDGVARPGGNAPCPSAHAARLGGDEFVVVLDTLTDPRDAAKVAQRLLETLAAPYQIMEREVVSTASIGVASVNPEIDSADELLGAADIALYRAKAEGKNRFVVFDSAMHEQAVARMQTEIDLRYALERNEMRLHYQPILSAADGTLLGFESLLRWEHPTRGLIPPDQFVSIAEETGLIEPIGNWVLTEASRQLAEWRARPGAGQVWVNVNLSKRQLTPDLQDRYLRIVRDAGLTPGDVRLEVTESLIVQDSTTGAEALLRLRDAGFSLLMDDFGTGLSSLSVLHQLPFAGLKIDRSFIANLQARRDYAAVVSAIIILAHNLHLTVTAEGVETLEQVQILQALDCDQLQGYYFSMPMPAQEACRFIDAPPRSLAA